MERATARAYAPAMSGIARVGVIGLLVVGAGACLEMPEGTPVEGTPADVTTVPGDYVGYRVVTACPQTHVTFGVIGLGATVVTDVDTVAALGAELETQLTDVTSIWGSGGYGLGCEPGIATQLSLSSWRDVDQVIARTGEFLRTRDLALQVAIDVSSIPVPHAD